METFHSVELTQAIQSHAFDILTKTKNCTSTINTETSF